MIILRQKEYSDKKTKVLYGIGKLKNSIGKKKAELNRDFWSGINPGSKKSLERVSRANRMINEKSKSRRQIMKDAIKTRQSLDKKVSDIKRLSYQDPAQSVQEVVTKGARKVGENPVGTATWAATSLLPVPSTVISIAAEEAADNASNGYRKYKAKIKNKKSRPVADFLGNLAGGATQYAKTLAV